MRILVLFAISFNLFAFSFEVDTSPLSENFRSQDDEHYFKKRRVVSIAAWGMGAGLLTYLFQRERKEQYKQYLQFFGVGLLPVLALNEGQKYDKGSSVGFLEMEVRILPMIAQLQPDQLIPGVQICIDF